MYDPDPVTGQVYAAFNQIQYLIRLLYGVRDPDARDMILNQLWNQVAFLQFLCGLLSQRAPSPGAAPPYAGKAPPARAPTVMPPHEAPGAAPPGALPTFTREQLATYTGRNGAPAYVAVNGTVYDVTNNHAWSLATHFGLAAGRDLTPDFASCHAGQQWILGTLRPVGRLV